MPSPIITPNCRLPRDAFRIMVALEVMTFIILWSIGTPTIIPKPWEVVGALQGLWFGGLAGDLMTSVILYVESVLVASVLSLGWVYASTLPLLHPMTVGWSKLRFLGLVGLPFLFTLYIHNVHVLKVALVSFSISVFLVTSLLDVVAGIPQEKYDLARTLRMGEWQVLWEVVVLGQMDGVFDAIRSNGAIGWMMIPAVESLFRFEGGIGAVLVTQAKYFHLSEIMAIQLSVLAIGIGQDYGIAWIKHIVCPWAEMGMAR